MVVSYIGKVIMFIDFCGCIGCLIFALSIYNNIQINLYNYESNIF